MAAGTVKRDLYVVASATADNISIPTNSSGSADINVSKSGYTPLCVVGFDIVNASSSGSGDIYCYPIRMFYNSSSGKAVVKIGSRRSEAAKVKCTVHVLYRANN